MPKIICAQKAETLKELRDLLNEYTDAELETIYPCEGGTYSAGWFFFRVYEDTLTDGSTVLNADIYTGND